MEDTPTFEIALLYITYVCVCVCVCVYFFLSVRVSDLCKNMTILLHSILAILRIDLVCGTYDQIDKYIQSQETQD